MCHLAPELSEVTSAEDDVQVSGRHAWAGGRLPEGTTGLGYGFDADQSETAVIRDGWWAMQLVAEEPITGASMQWGELTAEGSEGGGIGGYTRICDPQEPDC